MLNKNNILDKIISLVLREKEFINVKSSMGLFDDNKHWENIIRKLLNDSFGYELVNLNREQYNYPGIDLGDEKNRIGIQISTTKTSAKIKNTLDMMIENKVYEKYNNLKVFILGDKQMSYSINMEKYEQLVNFHWEKDIWDFSDLLRRFSDMDAVELMEILKFLQQECGEMTEEQIDKSGPCAMEIITYLKEVKCWIDCIAVESRSLPGIYELENSVELCENVSRLLSTQEYTLLIDLFEWIKQLVQLMNSLNEKGEYEKSYKLRYYANEILYRWNIYDTLVFKTNSKEGQIVDILIDMDSFQFRIRSLEIDDDIIENQFSMDSFKKLIENTVLKSCRNIILIYRQESQLLKRISQCKNVVLEKIENKVDNMESIIEKYKVGVDGFIVGTQDIEIECIINKYRSQGIKMLGLSFNEDLDWRLKGQFIDVLEIGRENDTFFEYEEEKEYDIRTLTIADYRKMISNGCDKVSHQIRVTKGGLVCLSRTVAAEDIDNLQFRWETYDAYNSYVGPRAASDTEYIAKTYKELIMNWEKKLTGYVDLWLTM